MNRPANRPPSYTFKGRSHPWWFETSRGVTALGLANLMQMGDCATKFRKNGQMGEARLPTNRVDVPSVTAIQIDRLAKAIAYMGGIAQAAKILRVTRATIL